MRGQYKHQPIVATDWPPRVGQDFFGRLALVEKQDGITEKDSAWYQLRGQVDKIITLTGHKKIRVEDVLKPTDTTTPSLRVAIDGPPGHKKIRVEDVLKPTDMTTLSLRVAIDGPPGIGKTTLCHKLLNMWSNGTLHQQYDLVLYCPLRNRKIATATTLTDLFVCQRYEVPVVAEWFKKRNGEGLLIIFDGWDELSTENRQSSLAASIICREQLDQCAVIVTSRSYASSSLLKLPSLSRHLHVIGFSENEIFTVIIQTLQKDQKLALQLIDENKIWLNFKEHCTTTQSSKDSQLAMKLINDLKVRGDVRSLCYIPLVCSMVILVYCKEGGHLPTTLTQLYENFILQTIRRHVEIKPQHDVDPYTLGSLSSLPSHLAKPLQEMCQIAYTTLTNTRMTFSSHELHQLSLCEAVKEDYLGLITAFTEYDEKKYQFLHLSIQEFLAAWWIAKHEEKSEEVLKTHFDNDHFRMCLRFVAGLTRLEHENYQQYFNKLLNLQCKRNSLSFGNDGSFFHQSTDIGQCDQIRLSGFIVDDSDKFPTFLIQLLYESQNTTLCQVLAQSINNYEMCLRGVSLSLFDWLCLSYFMNNSNLTWNFLHLGKVHDQTLSLFADGLNNNSLQTKKVRVELYVDNDELVHKFLRTSLICNIQEFYCEMRKALPYFIHILHLPKLKIFHLRFKKIGMKVSCWNELEKSMEMNLSIQELGIWCDSKSYSTQVASAFISVIKGVRRNKTITSLTLFYDPNNPTQPLPDGVIEQLLKDNKSLQALSINVHEELLPSSLNIHEEEIKTPLKALEIYGLMTSLLPHIKGLHCLTLPAPHPPHILFLSHPSLHTLYLPLYTSEIAIELFIILQNNTTLKALSVWIEDESVYDDSMGDSLQEMLTQNQTLKYLEINGQWYDVAIPIPIPSSFLSFLTTGLINNTSLQQLSAFITLPIDEETYIFFQKNNLTELQVKFILDESQSSLCGYEEEIEIMALFFYEQLLPALTNMLQTHTTIRILKIKCWDLNDSSQPNWTEIVQHLYETIFIHPTLEFVKISIGLTLLVNALKGQKKTLIERHREKQPHRPIPTVFID